jgi:hypothetical protein
VFTDYTPAAKLPARGDAPIEILDPVNPDNNIAKRYSDTDRLRVVAAAEEALDALTEARYAATKAQAVECWQVVIGTGFKG